MTDTPLAELWERLHQLERKIQPLDWDSKRKQINEFKKLELEKLKAEQNVLEQEMKVLQSNTPPPVLLPKDNP